MGDNESTSNRDALDEYMNVLLDIRRSTTVICDSIRTRERTALSLLGVSTGNLDGVSLTDCDPVRCAICIEEFSDPCVALTVCGHGMHEECVKTNVEQREDGSSRQIMTCPLCRIPFRKSNVLRLVGMHPPTGQSGVWRSVQLCAPWKSKKKQSEATGSESPGSDSLPEKLYLHLKTLFQQTNELGRAFEIVLHLHDEAAELRSKAVEEDQKAIEKRNKATEGLLRKEMELNKNCKLRMLKLEAREKKLINSEYQNEAFIANCLKAVKREEAFNLDVLLSIVARQKKLDRANEELSHRREMADSSIREMEKHKREKENVFRTRDEADKTERVGMASGVNDVMADRRSHIEDMRNPAFSDPSTSDADYNDIIEIVRARNENTDSGIDSRMQDGDEDVHRDAIAGKRCGKRQRSS